MKITKTKLDGVLIIEPSVFKDDRGYFLETYNQEAFENEIKKLYEAEGKEVDLKRFRFVQDNESGSIRDVIRGLHFQTPPYGQAKLVRCVEGVVMDVAVDIRKGSPTYGEYVSVILDEAKHNQFYIPVGFAHGFQVLSQYAIFSYKCNNYYNKESDGGIMWNDSDINIQWVKPSENYIVSEKDKNRLSLKDFDSPFIYGKNC